MSLPSSPDPSPPPAPRGEDGEENRAAAAADLELIRRARGGERPAVDRLARRLEFVPRLLRAIDRRRGGRLQPEDIDDLTQDAIIILWRKLEDFRGEGTLERWSYRICLLEYLNLVRKRSRRATESTLDGVDHPASPHSDAPADDVRDLYERALLQLDPGEEDVVRLKLGDDLTFGEVAGRLRIPSNTAKTRYYRGVARLRRALRRSFGEEDEA